jgi:cell wall-associated NlpC family hydrolase
VVSGDSLWLIAQKFNCSVKSLKKLNNLTKNNLKPGQVLKIPPLKGKTTSPSTTTAPAAKPDAAIPARKPPTQHKLYAKAQPVQDFDVPASTFASCPVPDPAAVSDKATKNHSTAPADTIGTSAPVAKLVSPEEMTADTASTTTSSPAPKTVTKAKSAPNPVPAPSIVSASPAPSAFSSNDDSSSSTPAPSTFSSSSSKGSNHSSFFSSSSSSTPSPSTGMSSDWANRFRQHAQELSSLGLEYDESWRPPGESRAWAMDCSNTARYLYKVTAGLELPRTASDQYYYLHLQNKAWDVPQTADGNADVTYLRENLKVGDLLFWENTYRPERQPPITHVMVFLGTNDKGQWIMVGSQTSRGGEHNRRNGGPDIYVFDPLKPCGGYTTWLGLVRHKGRFCAYGRPLEADPSKLSVASN